MLDTLNIAAQYYKKNWHCDICIFPVIYCILWYEEIQISPDTCSVFFLYKYRINSTVAMSHACLQAADTQTLHAQPSGRSVLWWRAAPDQFIKLVYPRTSCRLVVENENLTSFPFVSSSKFFLAWLELICLTWHCAPCSETFAHVHIPNVDAEISCSLNTLTGDHDKSRKEHFEEHLKLTVQPLDRKCWAHFQGRGYFSAEWLLWVCSEMPMSEVSLGITLLPGKAHAMVQETSQP